MLVETMRHKVPLGAGLRGMDHNPIHIGTYRALFLRAASICMALSAGRDLFLSVCSSIGAGLKVVQASA